MKEIEKEFITILDEYSANEEIVEVIVHFMLTNTKYAGNEYLVYTKNERDLNGNITVYISRVTHTDSIVPTIQGIEDDNEYEYVLKVIEEMKKG